MFETQTKNSSGLLIIWIGTVINENRNVMYYSIVILDKKIWISFVGEPRCNIDGFLHHIGDSSSFDFMHVENTNAKFLEQLLKTFDKFAFLLFKISRKNMI